MLDKGEKGQAELVFCYLCYYCKFSF